MGILELSITGPLPNEHNKYTHSNNVCCQRRNLSVRSPTSGIVNIPDLHYFQIINTTDHCISQSNCYKNKKFVIHSMPNNSSFPLEREYRRQSCQTCHKNCPSKSSSSRTSIQTFQIPKKLRSCSIRKLSRGFNSAIVTNSFFGIRRTIISSKRIAFISMFCKKRNWTINRPELHPPDTQVYNYIDNHVSPENTNGISSSSCKDCRIVCSLNVFYQITSAKRHKKLPHMTYTTIRKQSLDICLCLWCNSSNNHRKCSKQSLSTSKRHIPNNMPMMCPEPKNCDFRQNRNPQGHTRPCPHVYVRNPEMLRGCCLFPKQSCRYQPNTKSSQQRRSCSCSLDNLFNMRQRSFPCLPINKTNTLKQLATSKGTQLEIFHSCFKRICTFGIQTTKNYLRETLQFHTKVKRHQISGHNLLVLTNQCLHCLIDIFCMANKSSFLPTIRYSQNKTSSKKLKSAQTLTVSIFLKTPTLKYKVHRTSYCQLKREKTPKNCPQSQWGSSMIRSSCLVSTSKSVGKVRPPISYGSCPTGRHLQLCSIICGVFSFRSLASNGKMLISYCQNFSNWSYKVSCTLPKQNKKTKNQKKLRSKKNQIQTHLLFGKYSFFVVITYGFDYQQKRESNP